jgi:hypothetical protein
MAKFETAFSCGDKGWAFCGEGPAQLTVGQIRIEYTHSKGLRGGYVDDDIPVAFDNFKPKKSEYHEVYMCVESGIGCGTLWELGKNFFRTEQECLQANAERIKQMAEAKEECRRLDLERAQRRIEEAQREIARLEASATNGGGASSY